MLFWPLGMSLTYTTLRRGLIPFGRPAFADEEWDPLGAAMQEVVMVLGFHVGTEPHDPTQRTGVCNTGRGRRVQRTDIGQRNTGVLSWRPSDQSKT
jgi:hypothetical protein